MWDVWDVWDAGDAGGRGGTHEDGRCWHSSGAGDILREQSEQRRLMEKTDDQMNAGAKLTNAGAKLTDKWTKLTDRRTTPSQEISHQTHY